MYSVFQKGRIKNGKVMKKGWPLPRQGEPKRNELEVSQSTRKSLKTLPIQRVMSYVILLIVEVEATPERTRFSVLTADRPTESVIDEYETVGRGLRGGDAASLQGQLNEIFHHVRLF
jgi:hypothetical protein